MNVKKIATKTVALVGAGLASLDLALAELIEVSLIGGLDATGVGIVALAAFLGFGALVFDYIDYVSYEL